MESRTSKTEKQILDAADKVFQNKGFKNSKISEIAELAGVNNALINYYFRSKENLFNKVLHAKIDLLAQSMSNVIDRNIAFCETIKDLVEAQFDFFRDNESLPRFILSEILIDESRIDIFRENVIPVIIRANMDLDNRLREEIAAGRVRNMEMFDLLYAITSVNVLCFLVEPIFRGADMSSLFTLYSQVMNDRKKKNVEIIMSYLKV